MVAIQTKYLRATNTSGARIKAYTSSGQSFILSWKPELKDYQNYEMAAHCLCTKLGWSTDIIGGGTKEGYTFVFLPC